MKEKDIFLNGVPLSEYVDEAEAARQANTSRRYVQEMHKWGFVFSTPDHFIDVFGKRLYTKAGIEAIKAARRRAPKKNK